jgi:hypothetical protein
MGTLKVNNDEVWNDYVKTGKVKGFSIEGYFADKMQKPKVDMSEEKADLLLSQIKGIVKGEKVELSLLNEIKEINHDFDMAISEGLRISRNIFEFAGALSNYQDDLDGLKVNYKNSNGAKNGLGFFMQKFDKIKNDTQQKLKELGLDTNIPEIKEGEKKYKRAKELFKDLEQARNIAKGYI